jgi:hypothetical protein
MVLGQSHHLGPPKARPDRYEKVAEFGWRNWDVKSFEHRWSAQGYSPDDGVPYIGRVTPRSERVYVATGFKKWEMTGGILSGMLISDAIMGRENPWAPMFSATRIKPLAEGLRFVSENGRVGVRFLADRLLARGGRDIADLAPGEGGIVSSRGGEGGRLPRQGRRVACGLGPVHSSGLPGGMECRREQLGLSVPRISVQPGRGDPERPGHQAPREATDRPNVVTHRKWPDPRHNRSVAGRVRDSGLPPERRFNPSRAVCVLRRGLGGLTPRAWRRRFFRTGGYAWGLQWRRVPPGRRCVRCVGSAPRQGGRSTEADLMYAVGEVKHRRFGQGVQADGVGEVLLQ